MRLLTDEDMRWVAGGMPTSNGGYDGQMYTDSTGTYIWQDGEWQLYDIPVTGSPPPPPPYYPEPPSGGGGGGGGVITPPPPPPNGGEGSEIIIQANSTQRSSALGQLFHFYGGVGLPNGGNFIDPNSYNPPDCRETQVEYDSAATQQKSNTDQATKLSHAIEAQSDRVRGMPSGLTVTDPSGNIFTTGAEIKDLWSKTDFVVTGILPGDARGGATRGNPGNPTLEVYSGYLDSYLANDVTQTWYFFHELAHATASGQAMNAAAFESWYYNRDGKTYEQSDPFIANERVMNTVAANIAEQYGVNLRTGYPNVPHGYGTGYAVAGTGGSVSPDRAGSGPGGTC